jgi:hypothetical protein
MASARRWDALQGSRECGSHSEEAELSIEAARYFHDFSELSNGRAVGKIGLSPELPLDKVMLWTSASKWEVDVPPEIYRRTLDSAPFFVDNEAKAPVLMKERQPIAPGVLIDSTLAENRELSFAHLNLNEGRFNPESSSDNGCIDAKSTMGMLQGAAPRDDRAPQF